MQLINNIYRWIFIVKYTSDFHRQLRSLVCDFYDNYDNNKFSFNSYRITKCRFYKFPKSIVIEIYSLSPGIIIGKGGRCIDDLKAYMQNQLCKPIDIKLKETNPFK